MSMINSQMILFEKRNRYMQKERERKKKTYKHMLVSVFIELIISSYFMSR